jgi:hypothetical protein
MPVPRFKRNLNHNHGTQPHSAQRLALCGNASRVAAGRANTDSGMELIGPMEVIGVRIGAGR